MDGEGHADFSDLWPRQLNCDAGMSSPAIDQTAPVSTPLQQAVVAHKDPVPSEPGLEISDEKSLFYAYEGCGSNDPKDHYATTADYSPQQAIDVEAYLMPCPRSPAGIDVERRA
ncbi:MAG: hypothetical protein Q4G51_03165 [Dermatophilus congolensis]|nr:hypothetical protein [Dermatophilus congolensis]